MLDIKCTCLYNQNIQQTQTIVKPKDETNVHFNMFSLIWGFTTTPMWLCDDTLATLLNLGGDESNVQ